MARFTAQINDDLNLPRAMAVTWDLVRSDVPAATKQATLWQFDRVLGLQLSTWPPAETVVPEALMALLQQRQQARAEQRWQDADAPREQLKAAGYTVDDTPQGPRLHSQQLGRNIDH
jgi:cysteinyl-tRNA synthetase